MSDLINSLWEPVDNANTHPSPDGLQINAAPNNVPEVIRAMRGGLKRDFQQKNPLFTTSGAGNAYVLTYPQDPEGYESGLTYWFVADKTNTGAATLNINGLGNRAIQNAAGAALIAGQITAGSAICVTYLSNAFRVQFTHANPVFTGTVKALTLDATTGNIVTVNSTTVNATTLNGKFVGDGSSILNMNASELKSGTVHNDRMVGDYSFDNLTLSKTLAAEFVQIQTAGQSPTLKLRNAQSVEVGRLYADGGNNHQLILRKYNPTTGTGEGYLRIDGNGNDDLKYNGNTVWHTGNDASLLAAGAVQYYATLNAPAGWLKANGAAVSRVEYARLFAAIGTLYGAGDGTNTFNLPDLRGEFIRGFDDGRGVDASRGLGSAQTDSFASHNHTATAANDSHNHTGTTSNDTHNHTFSAVGSGNNWSHQSDGNWRHEDGVSTRTTSSDTHNHTFTTSTDTHTHAITVNANGGSETRPRNIALLACIKF